MTAGCKSWSGPKTFGPPRSAELDGVPRVPWGGCAYRRSRNENRPAKITLAKKSRCIPANDMVYDVALADDIRNSTLELDRLLPSALGSFPVRKRTGTRAYMGVWGRSPQRGPGAEPLVRGLGGEAPLKLKAFYCRREQICHSHLSET